jgi:hypothetical protein
MSLSFAACNKERTEIVIPKTCARRAVHELVHESDDFTSSLQLHSDEESYDVVSFPFVFRLRNDSPSIEVMDSQCQWLHGM